MSQSSKLKIALVANTSWSIYNFRVGLIRAFMTRGYDVHVIAPRDGYSDKLIAEGVHFQPLPIDNYSTNPLRDLRSLYFLYRVYRQEQFTMVFHYTIKPIIYGSIAASWAGIRSIAITTGLGKMFRFESRITQAVISALYKYAANCAEQMWFLNGSDRDRMTAAGIVLSDKTMILSSEGINTDKYRPSRKEKRTSMFRFLFAGRLLREKGVYDYVAAAREIRKSYKHARFELLGFLDDRNPDSVSLADIEAWQQEGLINYLGSTEDVRPYIDRVDCVVLPSYYQEGISRILLEAASMATPVITSDQPGCAQVIEDGRSGIVVRERDHDGLVTAMSHLLALSQGDLIRWGEHGRAYVKQRYNEDIVIKRYIEVLDQPTKMIITYN